MAKATKSQAAQAKQHFASTVIILACLVPSLIVGFAGLSRPYDAIPDQDMLWASEALRLLRGVAPSYADHPGAFWTLLYKLNIQTSHIFFGATTVDPDGNILPLGISTVIKTARIQNAALSGICCSLIYLLTVQLNTGKVLAATAALTASLSSAILIGVSEIRHEAISVLFILAFTVCMGYSYSEKLSNASRHLLSAFGIFFFFAAALSKQQVLLCAPLAFVASLSILNREQNKYFTNKLASLGKVRVRYFILLLAFAVTPWLIAAHPDIDLVNMPFWALINLGLAICISPIVEARHSQPERPLLMSLAVVGLYEIIVLKLLAPGWWRQGVTGFPSWMFRYADATSDRSFHTIDVLKVYFEQLFTPSAIAFFAFLAITVISTLAALPKLKSRFKSNLLIQCALPASWITTTFIAIACSQRLASRYEIYFYAPILILSAVSAAGTKPGIAYSKGMTRLLKYLSILLLATAIWHSTSNATDLEKFVNQAQPKHFLCFGHHMDRTMRLTSAGQCPNFNEAALSKNAYDNWNGPH